MARGRPSNEARLQANISRLKEARKWRSGEGYDDLWMRMRDLYRGKQYNSKSDEDRMLVNIAFATKNVIAPSVAINNPKFVVNARRPDGAPQAIITEQVLNYLWRVNKYQDEFRLAVDDMLIAGHGWLKVGYKVGKEREEKVVPDAHPGDEGDDYVGISDKAAVDGNSETENYTNDDEAERPYVERISYHDMLCDPDARHPHEMKWIAQRVRRVLADVQVDVRYDQAARKKVTGEMSRNRVESDDEVIIEGEPSDPNTTYIDVYEYYDLRRGTVSTLAMGLTSHFLIKPKEIPYPFGHPFVMLRNYEVPDMFYPMGELEQIEPLQHELNATRSQMMNHRKRYNRKSLIDKQAFEKEGLDALQSDKDNTIVPVDLRAAVSGSLNGVIVPMPQEATPPDFYNQTAQITQDIDRVSGVSDYMRGAQSEIRRTATEAAMIQDAMNARAAEKLARVEGALSELGKRVVQLMQLYMTGEHVVRIIGRDQAPIWITYDADYLQGEFDFEVEGGSTQPRNESFRRQSAMQLVDALAPFIGEGMVNPQAVVRHVLQYGFDVKDPDQFMAQPQGAPPAEGAPPEGGPPPEGMPPGAMPPEGMPPQGMPPQGAPTPGGVPPELMQQLMGQL